MTMTMFIGEFMCLPVFYIMQYMERRKKKQGDVYQQLNDFDNTDPAQLSTLVTTTPGNQGVINEQVIIALHVHVQGVT